jgi:hypothetical protein
VLLSKENSAQMLNFFLPLHILSVPLPSSHLRFATLYLASDEILPEGREGSEWKPSEQ